MLPVLQEVKAIRLESMYEIKLELVNILVDHHLRENKLSLRTAPSPIIYYFEPFSIL